MDSLLLNKSLPQCDDVIAEMFLEDSGIGLDFDFRNDGTISPMKVSPSPSNKSRHWRFSPQTETYSKQKSQLTAAKQQAQHLLNEDLSSSPLDDITGALSTVFDSRYDLQCISPDTLSDVLRGACPLGSYAVIDCRYPYEFNGGHIQNAINIHQQNDIEKLLTSPNKPDVLIFHCEFSIERGPAMCRHLRQKDRAANAENYPHLTYPMTYLLQGGYKAFFQTHPEHCTDGYTPMLDQTYADDLRHFRRKSKTWCPGSSRPKKGLRLFD